MKKQAGEEYMNDAALNILEDKLMMMVCRYTINPDDRSSLAHDLRTLIKQAKTANKTHEYMEASNRAFRKTIAETEKLISDTENLLSRSRNDE